MLRKIQTNFTSGELDPLVAGRHDVKHYYNGAEKLRNVLVLPQGGAKLRPGLEYVDELLDVLTRFTGQTITCPQGGTTANANDNDTATEVQTTGAIGTVNPYIVVHYDLGSAQAVIAADVVGLRVYTGSGVANEFYIQYSTDNAAWTSLGNPIPVTTADHHRRVTGPITARYWRVARIGATDLGAALVRLDEFTIWTESGTLSESALVEFEFSTTEHYMLLFTDRNIAVYRAGVWQCDVRSPYTSANLALLNWTQSLDTAILVHPSVYPQKLIRQGDHDEWQVETITFDALPRYAFTETVTNPAVTLTPSAASGNITLTASLAAFTTASVGQYVEGNSGRARIVRYDSTTVVGAVVEIPFLDTSVMASGSWDYIAGYEDAWSASRGYPVSATFYEGRLYFGGSSSLPASIWGSRVGQFFNFDIGQNLDDEAIAYTIGSDDVPAITNLYPGRNLQIFTTSSEWFAPQTANEPLTPSNFSLRRATSRGSKAGSAVAEVSGATFFLQKEGKSLREYLFNDVEQSYNANNISLLSSHLLSDPAAMAIRKSTSTDEADLVLLVNDDGTLAVLTTLREQEVTAWSLCTTDGTFEDVGVDQTDTYFVTERNINGTVRKYLEMFNSDLHVDCGVLYAIGTPVSTLSNLSHLNGETVKVVLDSAVQADEVVSGGSITLGRNASDTAEVGLSFTPQIKPMPAIIQLDDGTNMDRKKRIREVTLGLHETSDILVDGQRPAFLQFGAAGAGSPLDVALTPFTGRKTIEGKLGWSDLAQLDITGELPVSLTLLYIEMKLEI